MAISFFLLWSSFFFPLLCEINLWLRFISLKEAGVDEILLIYCVEHTSSQREKMKNWNDRVALLACCWGNWSGLCCAVLWWVEIKCVRIYLDHPSEEKDYKIYSLSIYVLRKSPNSFFDSDIEAKQKWNPFRISSGSEASSKLSMEIGIRVSIDNWNMSIM